MASEDYTASTPSLRSTDTQNENENEKETAVRDEVQERRHLSLQLPLLLLQSSRNTQKIIATGTTLNS